MPNENDQLLNAIQNQPWALQPAKLEEISIFIERRLSGDKIEFPESAAGKSGNRAEDSYEVRQGVAVLPVFGILGKRMNLLMRISGGTSTEILARNFRRALKDPQVEAIMLDVDSPGGSIAGTKEAADVIYGARGQKPIVAYANGLMASAAYWIGAAADVIVAPDTALVGSIGVVLMHFDYSKQDEKLGVKRTAITAGKFKHIASDEKPLSEEGGAYLQDLVDEYYGLFLGSVAQYRGTDPETVHEKMGDGKDFIGKKALRAGLVDKMGTFDSALALAQQMGGTMDLQTLQEKHVELFNQVKALGAGEVTLESLLAKQPEAAEAWRQEGRDQERARAVEILEVQGSMDIKCQAVKEGLEPKAAFKLMLEQQEADKTKALAELAGAAPPPVGQDVETITVAAEENLEAAAKQEWDKDPQLRNEFKEFNTYLAWRRAEAEGRAKVLKK